MIQKSLYLYFSGEFLRCSEVVLGVFSQKKQCFWFFCGESASLFGVFLSLFHVFFFVVGFFFCSQACWPESFTVERNDLLGSPVSFSRPFDSKIGFSFHFSQCKKCSIYLFFPSLTSF